MRERVASLLASGTEAVCALGLQDRLVGISHECDYPPQILDLPRLSRPRFRPEGMSSNEIDAAVRRAMAEHGSVYEVDAEALGALRPDLVLTQAVCEVCAVPAPGVRDLVRERGIGADVLSLDSHTIEEILASITDVAIALGEPARAEDLVGGLRRRIAAVEDAVAGAARPRVLALEWLDPPFTPGHWVPEMVELAGGTNLAGVTGDPSREVGWEQLQELDPDVLVIMPCGFGIDESRDAAAPVADRLAMIAPRAFDEDRAFVVDGSAYFNRSGPRVVNGIEILGGLLHPDRVPPPPQTAAAPWVP